ncbi:hypothetical protein GCM10010267_38350 [Streptomyces griseorubens]|nr:hypothetical protein GCM10010267_38350 [Streptomyces griseorubens]
MFDGEERVMSGTRTAPSLNRDGAAGRTTRQRRTIARYHSVPKAITEYSFSRLVKSLAYTEDMYSPPCPNWISE